jgi:hypothetical protein
MLFRMLAPKPLKQVRRAAHPVSLLTPRPVQRARMAAVNVANPLGATKRAAESAVVRGVRSGRGSTYRAPSLTAYEREARRVARLNQFEEVRALDQQLVQLTKLHLEPFQPASAPIASPAEPVDKRALFDAAKDAAFAEIPWWKRSDRKQAREKATNQADAEAATEMARREAERKEQQLAYDEVWAKLLANDPDTVEAILGRAFADNEHPASAVGVKDGHASIVMTVPSVDELIHGRQAELTPTGRPTTKPRSKTTRNYLYLGVLASGAIATAREAFAVAPSLKSVAVVVDQRGKPGYLTPVLGAQFSRSSLPALEPDQEIYAGSKIAVADGVEMNVKGRTDELAPLDLSKDPGLSNQLNQIAESLGLSLDPATKAK